MSVATPWNKTPSSDARMNKMTVISGTGAELAALDKTKHRLVTCTSTGSGFTLDHTYLFSTDGTTAIDLSNMSEHTHASSTTGGILTTSNPEQIDLLLIKTDDLKKAQWHEAVTGTGSIEDSIDGTTGERSIRLRPNATSGSGATIRYPVLALSFATQSMFVTKLRIETASSLALHTGVNADDVTDADTNDRKYNAEVCTATNNNWFVRSANGSANSTSDTGTAITTSRTGIRLRHLPTAGTPEVTISINGGASFQKTTHIPTSSISGNARVVIHSIKNSTAADRPMHTYGTRLFYWTGTEWGF